MAAEKTFVAIDLEPETAELGAFSPLHITLTPPVRLDVPKVLQLTDRLRETLCSLGALTLTAVGEDHFGSGSDPVRVRTFARTPQLIDLHSRVLSVVQELVPDVDRTYTGDTYQPHSTYQGDHGIAEGEVLDVREVVILRKEDGRWQRVGKILLEEPSADGENSE